ncbi:MAG: Stealth CR1 domain-containing protein [Marinoscillum sp.]
MKDSNKDLPIDLVYTWVDGNDPEYLKIYNEYAETPKDINPERVRDTYDMLKYSLRSVEKYLPWIRTIYIVTARPQIPDWLQPNHHKVKVIHHDQIIDKQYLPTFNYNTIESYVHSIPDLSEYFLYCCDDFLFGSDVHISDFIDNEGKITVFGTLFGENLKFRIYERKFDIVSLGLVEHNPIFFKKSYIEELQSHYKNLFHATRDAKFRRNDNVTMQKVYKQWVLSNYRELAQPIKVTELLKVHTFHKITNNLKKQEKAMGVLERKSPKFFCLNDDQRDNPNPKVVKLIQDFLNRNYPDKSEFEL